MATISSYEDAVGLRCVDVIERDDGSFVFKEFRRDPEDGGRWMLVRDFSGRPHANKRAALAAAAVLLPWLPSEAR